MSSYINKGQVIEGVAQTFLDQIKTAEDTWATADDLTAINVYSYDMATGNPNAESSLNLVDSVLDERSFAFGWNADDEGFNGKLNIGGEHWPKGDRTVRLQIVYAFKTGAPRVRLWELQVIELLGGESSSSSSDVV